MLELAILFVFPWAMAFAATTDLFTMTISNRLCLAIAISFFVLAPFVGISLPDMGWHLLTGLVVLGVSFSLFAFGVIGGGDAKFAAGTALWLGHSFTLEYLLYGAIFGGQLTIAVLILRRYPLPFFLARIGWIDRLHNNDNGVPYGIALAIAGLIVYTETPFFQTLIAAA